MSGLRVVRAGPQSLLQDAGRRGWQHLGVSPAGPMDVQAAAWANRLVNNPWGTALLEIALGGVELEADVDTWVSLAGAELDVHLDDQPLAVWTRFAVRRGQRLRLGFARSGQRIYLAVAGGFQLEPVLGSVSVQLREGLGGLAGDGSPLQAGYCLPCASVELSGRASVPAAYRPDYRQMAQLRVMLGMDAADFAPEQIELFFNQDWQLSPQSDRMGARLSGLPIQAPKRQWSTGVGRGVIQVPPDGQPIILQADHQTMGGYPLLGWLHPLDLCRLAQCPAHHAVRFSQIDLDQAQVDLRAFYRFFRR
ncbi:5-oxoprolinase subunit C family protein [Pseudomonas sp. TTU2014-080ASC]|uniref:5-oxoprolinase subunit C family protein n=1 Tax=Pseudomonas sp. TTU2014-080ASC TaxID=1729724 RepID=UPI000AADCB76|nr:biotin-dependent carboxyltransferase family protein [Pseudomonas sp. TTU2014-080ASC]